MNLWAEREVLRSLKARYYKDTEGKDLLVEEAYNNLNMTREEQWKQKFDEPEEKAETEKKNEEKEGEEGRGVDENGEKKDSDDQPKEDKK